MSSPKRNEYVKNGKSGKNGKTKNSKQINEKSALEIYPSSKRDEITDSINNEIIEIDLPPPNLENIKPQYLLFSPRFREKPHLKNSEREILVAPNFTLNKVKNERFAMASLGKKFYNLNSFKGQQHIFGFLLFY